MICVSGECLLDNEAICCGNKECQEGENECSCPQDCGKCESTEQFMKKECNDDNECVGFLNTEIIDKSSQTMSVPAGGNTVLSFSASFDNPFILGHSKFNIKIKPDKLDDKTEIEIMRIKIFDNDRNILTLLGEKDINQRLYTINSEIDEDFILKVDRNNSNTEEFLQKSSAIKIEVIYDTHSIDYYGQPTKKSNSFQRDLKDVMNIVIPPDNQCIEADCNDNNPCTQDACVKVNGYEYCDNSYILNRNCCGNKQCDQGEDKCSCPVDCGECDYDYGKSISYACNKENKCVPQVREGIQEEKSFVFKSSLAESYVSFEAKLTYDNPWNIDDTMKIEITLLDVKEMTVDATIKSIRIMATDVEALGELEPDDEFMEVGETKTYRLRPSMSMPDVERILRPKLAIDFIFIVQYGEKQTKKLVTEKFTMDEIFFVQV